MIKNLPKSIDEFITLCKDCEITQKEVLADILSTSADTLIGKNFDFNAIDSIETFRHHIKTTTWKDVAPLAKRLGEGDKNLLFRGKPPLFICTSGTSGKIKIMPESEEGKRLKALTTQLRVDAICKFSPSIMEGKFLTLVNHAIEGYTQAGTPYGSASGIALATASKALQSKVAFPMELLEIDYSEKMDYFLMRFAIAEDVRVIFGNNAERITQLIQTAQKETDYLINDIEKGTLRGIETLPEEIQAKLKNRMKPNPELANFLKKRKDEKKHFLPDVYWPNLQAINTWLSGSVGRYVQSLKPLISKDILFFDLGYGATEGKFNIPLEPNQAKGALSIYSAFYEFKEIESKDFLMAHELQIGKNYELYITTYSGLYRYDMKDIVKVEDFLGTTPMILFEQKAGDILNIAGEKIALSSLIPIINKTIIELTKNLPLHWCVVPDEDEKCYHFYVELSSKTKKSQNLASLIANHLENLLINETLIYPIFREQKLINRLKLTLMKNGWQKALYKKHTTDGRSTAQTKLPLIYPTLPLEEYKL